MDGTILGTGISGTVRQIVHRTTGIKYAVKCLDLSLISNTPEALLQLRNEIYIMCHLDHPNVMRIEEVYESNDVLYMIQEICTGGDLFDRLDQQPHYHYTEKQCASLVKQVSKIHDWKNVAAPSFFNLVASQQTDMFCFLPFNKLSITIDTCFSPIPTFQRHHSPRFKSKSLI